MNGLEKLGSSFLEINRLNHQILYNFLRLLKSNGKLQKPKFSKTQTQTEESKWKTYAMKLEREMKKINSLVVKQKLKNSLIENLDLYSFNSRSN